MKLFFTKMQELENDYICVDCLDNRVDKKTELAVRMSRRHTGIGADGLIFILPSKHADCRVETYKRDGSRSIGNVNGLRCAARYMYDRLTGHSSEIQIETDRGIYKAEICSFETYRIYGYTHVPQKTVIKLDIGGIMDLGEVRCPYPMQTAALGERYGVLFTDNLDYPDIKDIYRDISSLPEYVNTGIHIVVADIGNQQNSENLHIKTRIWENGIGEVMSSSGSACAVSAAAVWQGYCRYDENIEICQPGGVLTTAYLCDGRMMLEGPAEYVCEGVWKC